MEVTDTASIVILKDTQCVGACTQLLSQVYIMMGKKRYHVLVGDHAFIALLVDTFISHQQPFKSVETVVRVANVNPFEVVLKMISSEVHRAEQDNAQLLCRQHASILIMLDSYDCVLR